MRADKSDELLGVTNHHNTNNISILHTILKNFLRNICENGEPLFPNILTFWKKLYKVSWGQWDLKSKSIVLDQVIQKEDYQKEKDAL